MQLCHPIVWFNSSIQPTKPLHDSQKHRSIQHDVHNQRLDEQPTTLPSSIKLNKTRQSELTHQSSGQPLQRAACFPLLAAPSAGCQWGTQNHAACPWHTLRTVGWHTWHTPHLTQTNKWPVPLLSWQLQLKTNLFRKTKTRNTVNSSSQPWRRACMWCTWHRPRRAHQWI